LIPQVPVSRLTAGVNASDDALYGIPYTVNGSLGGWYLTLQECPLVRAHVHRYEKMLSAIGNG
jgi:hypothetical protein